MPQQFTRSLLNSSVLIAPLDPADLPKLCSACDHHNVMQPADFHVVSILISFDGPLCYDHLLYTETGQPDPAV